MSAQLVRVFREGGVVGRGAGGGGGGVEWEGAGVAGEGEGLLALKCSNSLSNRLDGPAV